MGQMMQIYNTSLEIGLRLLVVLSIDPNNKYEIDRLVYYDYFILYPSDYEVIKNSKDIQAKTPYRSGEILIKRHLIVSALSLLLSRGLIDIEYHDDGKYYKANKLTSLFLGYFNSNYYFTLKQNANNVVHILGKKSCKEIDDYITKHIGQWGTEFEYESVFRS